MRTTLSPQLRQQAKMSPQMFQSLEFLQLPILELAAHVQQELIDMEDVEDFEDNEQDENDEEFAENELDDKDVANEILEKIAVVSHKKIITKGLVGENIEKIKPIFFGLDDGKKKLVDKYFVNVSISVEVKKESSIENALQKNSNVTFLIHGPEIENSISGIIDRHPNARYSIDAILLRVGSPGGLLYTAGSKENFISIFNQNFNAMLTSAVNDWKAKIEQYPDKYMWGTDRSDAWMFDEEVSVLLEEFGRAFIGRLDPAVQEKFAYKNAERLLGD